MESQGRRRDTEEISIRSNSEIIEMNPDKVIIFISKSPKSRLNQLADNK